MVGGNNRFWDIATTALVILSGIFILLPIFWVFLTAFKSEIDVYELSVLFKPTLKNFREIFSNPQRHITFVTYAKFIGVENYMNVRRDLGAYVRTHRSETAGSFMTPTLRELKYTAPYMHNGVFGTLQQVVAFYNSGGGTDANKDPRIKPLGLSTQEQIDLVAFLEALSGDQLTGPEHVWKDKIPTDYPAIENWRKTPN